jgi:hypothetical protein
MGSRSAANGDIKIMLPKDKLKEILAKSSLTEVQQLELLEAFGAGDEQTLFDICNLLESNPTLIDELYNNLKAKKEALQLNDQKHWEEIIKKESQLLETLSNT